MSRRDLLIDNMYWDQQQSKAERKREKELKRLELFNINMARTMDKSGDKLVQVEKELAKYKKAMADIKALTGNQNYAFYEPELVVGDVKECINTLQNNILIYETFVHTLQNCLSDTTSSTVEVPRELIETILQRVRDTHDIRDTRET